MSVSGVYCAFKADLALANIKVTTAALKCALMTSTHNAASFDDTKKVWADVSANETSGTGYTAGGQAVTMTVTEVTVTKLDIETSTTWTITGSLTARSCVIYDTGNADIDDSLICSLDFGADKTVTDGTFSISWNDSGVITLT